MSMVIGGAVGAIGGSSGISVSGGWASFGAALVRAKLVPDPTSGAGVVPVLFDFSPKELKASRKVATQHLTNNDTPGSTAGSSGSNWLKTEPMELDFKAYLEGELTKLRGDKLLSWLSPGGGSLDSLALLKVWGSRASLPKLIFQWGAPFFGFVMYCSMASCSVSYTRFSALGVPLRAEATIKLKEEPNPMNMLNTNPTSGGRPGRHEHVMTQGENVVNVAHRRYADARTWRDIAEVNAIDDPLRVPPGRRIYLPAPDEVSEGR